MQVYIQRTVEAQQHVFKHLRRTSALTSCDLRKINQSRLLQVTCALEVLSSGSGLRAS
jgi:hypothetical protein